MENMDKKECSDCGDSKCGCGGKGMMSCMHGCCHHGRCGLLRMVLKIFVVIIIFWCGFKLGSIVGYVKAEYGQGITIQRGWDGNGGFGMMRTNDFYGNNSITAPSVPSTPATLTPVKQ